MLSAHEFATLMLVRDSADQIADREELDTLLERQLVAMEKLDGGQYGLALRRTAIRFFVPSRACTDTPGYRVSGRCDVRLIADSACHHLSASPKLLARARNAIDLRSACAVYNCGVWDRRASIRMALVNRMCKPVPIASGVIRSGKCFDHKLQDA